MGLQRIRPSHEILSGATADVYFARANSILDREGLDPVVLMEVFCREDAVLCGMGEATNLIGHVLANEPGAVVEALEDGDLVTPKEVVLRIRARYRAFALYETAMLGMLSQSTGWATAARECVDAAAPQPVISFGRVMSIPTSRMSWTTPRSSAAAWAHPPRPVPGWPASIRPAPCPTRSC